MVTGTVRLRLDECIQMHQHLFILQYHLYFCLHEDFPRSSFWHSCTQFFLPVQNMKKIWGTCYKDEEVGVWTRPITKLHLQNGTWPFVPVHALHVPPNRCWEIPLSFNPADGYWRTTPAPFLMHHWGALVIFVFCLFFSERIHRFASGVFFHSPFHYLSRLIWALVSAAAWSAKLFLIG